MHASKWSRLIPSWRSRASGKGNSQLVYPLDATTVGIADERLVATRRYLQYILMPLWFISGVADYICHRRSKIETTSGTTESFIHLLMMAEAGIPVLGGFYLEANAGLLALSLTAFVAHQATMLWDVAYAAKRRLVTPTEQHIHSALEMLPFCALSFLVCLHWDQFRTLCGAGSERSSIWLKKKHRPLPRAYSRTMTSTTSMLALLYAEEFWRCLNAKREGSAGRDRPAAAQELYDPPIMESDENSRQERSIEGSSQED